MKNRREFSGADLNGSLQMALGKLGALDTQQKGMEEIKDYLRTYKHSEDKISHFISSLNPNNEHMLSLNHKKEFIKLYGIMAEVLESECVPYLGKIFAALLKKLKEANPSLHETISQSYGSIVHNTLHTLPDLPSSCNQMTNVLKPLFEGLSSSNRHLQTGAGLCVTKIIQHSPLECLRYMLDKLSLRLVQLLSLSKAQSQIIEAIISLILSVEQDFAPYAGRAVPEILNCINNEDFNCRKQMMDALYTLGAVVPSAVAPFARDIMNVLNRARTDKVKPVRDAAGEAINLYKKLIPDTPPKVKVEVKSPREELKPKSIFKGPVNANFFKAANNDSIVEAPEKPSAREYQAQIFVESPRSQSPLFREQENPPPIEKFEFEESVGEIKEEHSLEKNPYTLASQVGDLKNEFHQFKDQVKMELHQINQRLGALEEMITTVSQLFDAKVKQITCNPNIANLLRN